MQIAESHISAIPCKIRQFCTKKKIHRFLTGFIQTHPFEIFSAIPYENWFQLLSATITHFFKCLRYFRRFCVLRISKVVTVASKCLLSEIRICSQMIIERNMIDIYFKKQYNMFGSLNHLFRRYRPLITSSMVFGRYDPAMNLLVSNFPSNPRASYLV